MAIQIICNEWLSKDIKTWYFYDIDGWEHNIYGKLADCEKLAKIKYAEDNDTDYGIINVSAWPR